MAHEAKADPKIETVRWADRIGACRPKEWKQPDSNEQGQSGDANAAGVLPQTRHQKWPARHSSIIGAATTRATRTPSTYDWRAKWTNFEATVELAGVPTLWRQADLDITASLKSYDAVSLARQIGVDQGGVTVDGGAQFRLTATGVPDKGLASEVTGRFGGLTLKAVGEAIALDGEPPKFTGTFAIETQDLGPLMRLVGLSSLGSGAIPVSLSGNVAAEGATTDISWKNGEIAGQITDGNVSLSEEGAELSIAERGGGQKIWTVGFTTSGWKLTER